jgi:hypothetical protein
MFTRSDLTALTDGATKLGVSIFLPTHVRGNEIRQGPIRLKNLAAEARDKLLAAGLARASADEMLAPAAALVEDRKFWQHQSRGLALFLDSGGARHYKVPLPLCEQAVVGVGFRLKPLLPVLAANGAFLVLTITANRVRLFEASRFSMAEDKAADLPGNLDEVKGEPDYENPVQAPPVARSHTGSIAIANAQVYGDSPEEWRKGRLVELVRRVGSALQARLAPDPMPVVLVADVEAGGHFQKLAALGPLLAGVVRTNPEAMDEEALHEAAYAVVRPHFEADRKQAVERFQALRGAGDARAATGIEAVVRAAYQGRINALLLAEGEAVWRHYDEAAGEVVVGEGFAGTGEDLLETAMVWTLQHGGGVHALPQREMPDAAPSAAILRY